MAANSLTIVFDNYPGNPELTPLWGFAAMLRLSGHTVLFDTGSNGRMLLKNMQALDLDPRELDMLFLSHSHWDHMGGLDSMLELNSGMTLVLHDGFSTHLIRDLRGMCDSLIVVGSEPVQLLPGIHSTGLFDSDPAEQAMVFRTTNHVVALSGCAHPGMEQIVRRTNQCMEQPVDWAIGGFHLMYQDTAAIEQTIQSLQALGIKRVVPTHCTGDSAITAFRAAYGPSCIDGGVGRVISIP